MSFLLSLFLLSQFPARWASCHFHCIGFSSHSASTTWAFAELGFCCAWPLPHRGRAGVVSTRLNPSHGTRYVTGVCNFLNSVLPQQKFEVVDQCYSSVTAQFYLASKWKYILKVWGWADPKQAHNSLVAPLLKCFFSSAWACPMYIRLARRAVSSPEFLTPVLGPSFVLFSLAFSFLCLLLLLLSRFSHVWLCATPQTAAHQALPSLGFSRQEHWSGLPFPPPILCLLATTNLDSSFYILTT